MIESQLSHICKCINTCIDLITEEVFIFTSVHFKLWSSSLKVNLNLNPEEYFLTQEPIKSMSILPLAGRVTAISKVWLHSLLGMKITQFPVIFLGHKLTWASVITIKILAQMTRAKLDFENQRTLLFAFPNNGWATTAATRKSMSAKQKVISSSWWAERASKQVAFRWSETHTQVRNHCCCAFIRLAGDQ